MKDYSVLNGMIENQKSELRTAYDKGYNHGVKDTNFQLAISKRQDEAYKQGLHDAWACCKRFLNSDDKVCDKIFGVSGWADFLDQSPSDAIEKFKEYDDKQKCIDRCCKFCKYSDNGMVGNSKRCEVCYYDEVTKANKLFEPMETGSCVEIGDEVRNSTNNHIGIVVKNVDENSVKIISSWGNTGIWELKNCNKTGKCFKDFAERLLSLQDDE